MVALAKRKAFSAGRNRRARLAGLDLEIMKELNYRGVRRSGKAD